MAHRQVQTHVCKGAARPRAAAQKRSHAGVHKSLFPEGRGLRSAPPSARPSPRGTRGLAAGRLRSEEAGSASKHSACAC